MIYATDAVGIKIYVSTRLFTLSTCVASLRSYILGSLHLSPPTLQALPFPTPPPFTLLIFHIHQTKKLNVEDIKMMMGSKFLFCVCWMLDDNINFVLHRWAVRLLYMRCMYVEIYVGISELEGS